MGVTAVFSGSYAPPSSPSPPGPRLRLHVSGDCPGCVSVGGRDRVHPNSSITLHVEFVSPPLGSVDVPGFETTDAKGTWTFEGTISCDFGGGPYVGPFVENVTATDAQGASASGRVMANCVAP